MLRRLLVLLAAIVVVATVLTGCGSSSPASGSAAITIGSMYPTSGSQGQQGREEARGVRLALEWVNAHGGVHGHAIHLISVSADRAEAVPAAMATLRQRGASVVVGTHGSAISAAAAAVATEHGMLLWETGAVGQTDPGVANGRNFFRLAPMGANLGRAAISFVRDELAGRLSPAPSLRYAVAYVDDAYGRAVGLGAVDEIRASHRDFAGAFPYPSSTRDFAALAARIAATHPNVLFVSAYMDDGVGLRKALVDAHVALLASIGTSSSYCMPEFGQRLGTDAVGLFASDKPDAADVRPDALTAAGRRTLEWASTRYRALYHEDMSAPALSGFANADALFAYVLPRTHTVDVPSVARAALATRLPVGTLANGGGLDLAAPGSRDAGENRNAASVIWEWVAPGQRAVVWPPAFATHPIETLPLAR